MLCNATLCLRHLLNKVLSTRVSMDVWMKAPGSMPLARKAGFEKRETLAVYPVLKA